MTLLVALLLCAPQEDLTVFRPEEQPRKMLYRYLEGESAKLLKVRAESVAALRTPEEVKRRREDIREKVFAALGEFPAKTPLRAKTTGTYARDGYRVENLVFEPRPDHHVPANLYVPDGKGPFPGIIFPLGHYDWPRAAEEYQRTCILLAKNGFVVLTYDPPGQGERHQLIRAAGETPAAKGTTEHTLVDCGALLVGACAAQYFIWDGIRALDYLESRPEVDAKRFGCLGNSGGGTLTAYLMAVDDRIGCAIPNCFITSLERLYATIGPQDGEANLPGQVAFGLDHADFFLLRAPRPSQLSCPNRDYYDIQGCWTTFREAKRLYGILGHAERMDIFEWDDKHSISKPGREAALRWLRRWLMGLDDAPTEPDFAVAKEDDLRVTKCGNVILEYQGRTLYDLTADREKELRGQRHALAKGELIQEVRRLIAVDKVVPATWAEVPGSALERPGFRIVRKAFEVEPGIKVPALSFVSPEKESRPPLLYVSGEGMAKAAARGGAMEEWFKAGYAVTAIDLRGMGETNPEAPHKGLSRNFLADWKEVYLGFGLKRPLLGQRVRDILAVRDALDPEGRGLHLVGVGSASPVALHAAALEPRISALTLEGLVTSWSLVARTPLTMNQLTNVVPGALRVYDLPDLAAAIAPRALTLKASTDAGGKPVAQAALEEAYAAAKAAYVAQNAVDRLVLQAAR